MAIQHYSDLLVWQKAYTLALSLHKISNAFPKEERYGGLVDQLRRSSKSVCANIAEGFGKSTGSRAEFKRYLMIARGSAYETEVWLKFAVDLDYLPSAHGDELKQACNEVARMIYALHQRWE